jgi:hypothetical protein
VSGIGIPVVALTSDKTRRRTMSREPDLHGEGPWEVRFKWTTGYEGVERLPTEDRAIRFCDEILKRIEPPRYDVSLRVRNVETGATLRDVIPNPPDRVVIPRGGLSMATCGTCDGSGEIVIIQTGKTIPCSRCNGTGQE